jgi:hypothetical protein
MPNTNNIIIIILIKWSERYFFCSANKSERLEHEYVIDGLRSVYVHVYSVYSHQRLTR